MFLTGIIAAMLDGIENTVDPGAAVPGDVGGLSSQEALRRSIPPVPQTLERALDALGCDDVLRAALGPLIVEEFIRIKRSEWDAFRLHVGDWDRSWYMGRY